MQLNAIFRLKKCMSHKELEVVLKSFIYSNFDYFTPPPPLFEHSKKNYENNGAPNNFDIFMMEAFNVKRPTNYFSR